MITAFNVNSSALHLQENVLGCVQLQMRDTVIDQSQVLSISTRDRVTAPDCKEMWVWGEEHVLYSVLNAWQDIAFL